MTKYKNWLRKVQTEFQKSPIVGIEHFQKPLSLGDFEDRVTTKSSNPETSFTRGQTPHQFLNEFVTLRGL